MTAAFCPPPQTVFFSDRARAPDWRATLSHAGPTCGLILRDYDAPARVDMAKAMQAVCRKEGRFFAIAGDAKLARALGASFHCPSYLLRQPLRHGAVTHCDTAATHDRAEILAAARAGFRHIFISPIFATNSHVGQTGLGPVRARALAHYAIGLGLTPLALGGLDAVRLSRLNGASPVFHGYGAIDALAGA